MDSSEAPSILIVGAGIFGTSTAYHLSLIHSHPHLITLLDRTASPPSSGASTDINKIVRTDYSSRFYMDLASEALEAWNKWDILSDEAGRFFHNTGWLCFEEEDSDLGERIRRNFKERGCDPTTKVGLDEGLREMWGCVLKETEFGGFKGGYFNPEAGWADAGAAVKKMTQLAMERGVKYVLGDVECLTLDRSSVTGVKTKTGDVYNADKILLCTGAWTSQILGPTENQLDMKGEDRIERQLTAAGVCVAHFKLTDVEVEELKDMPVVIYGGRGEVIPPPTRKDPGSLDGYHILKFTNAKSFTNTIAMASGHTISAPPDRNQNLIPEKLKQETVEKMTSKTLPQYANRQAEYWRLCWDSITPGRDQLITRHPHPRLSNLYLAVGGSFHSWKFLPTIGRYVVNVLNGVSNGDEKDAHWRWKTGEVEGRGAHEKLLPRRELAGFEEGADV